MWTLVNYCFSAFLINVRNLVVIYSLFALATDSHNFYLLFILLFSFARWHFCLLLYNCISLTTVIIIMRAVVLIKHNDWCSRNETGILRCSKCDETISKLCNDILNNYGVSKQDSLERPNPNVFIFKINYFCNTLAYKNVECVSVECSVLLHLALYIQKFTRFGVFLT